MEKTINCADCEIEFKFEENPKFPRKYCLNCGARRKKEFKQGTTDTFSKAETPEVVKFTSGGKAPKDNGVKKDNGYHLTPEQCRSNALASAIEYNPGGSNEVIMDLAKQFEKYIVTGE